MNQKLEKPIRFPTLKLRNQREKKVFFLLGCEKGYNESFNARDKIMGCGNENEHFKRTHTHTHTGRKRKKAKRLCT